MTDEGATWLREIRLDDRNLVAGAQILAWIALPHRPQAGVDLLNQWLWSRRKFRRESMALLPFTLRKQNRISSQLIQFNRRVLDAFRAGIWFDRRCYSALPGDDVIVRGFRSMGASTRLLAQSHSERFGIEPSNSIRLIWSKRKPVLHLASAAAHVLASKYADEDRRGFDLERTVFWPNWVAETIERAEQ